jgi:hypothetical protein
VDGTGPYSADSKRSSRRVRISRMQASTQPPVRSSRRALMLDCCAFKACSKSKSKRARAYPRPTAVSICACCAPSLSLENMFDLDHGLSHNSIRRASLCIPWKSKTMRALDGMSWTRGRHGSGPEVRGPKLASLTGNLPSTGEYWLQGVLTAAAKGHRIEL